jgi:hypothetical protein
MKAPNSPAATKPMESVSSAAHTAVRACVVISLAEICMSRRTAPSNSLYVIRPVPSASMWLKSWNQLRLLLECELISARRRLSTSDTASTASAEATWRLGLGLGLGLGARVRDRVRVRVRVRVRIRVRVRVRVRVRIRPPRQ